MRCVVCIVCHVRVCHVCCVCMLCVCVVCCVNAADAVLCGGCVVHVTHVGCVCCALCGVPLRCGHWKQGKHRTSRIPRKSPMTQMGTHVSNHPTSQGLSSPMRGCRHHESQLLLLALGFGYHACSSHAQIPLVIKKGPKTTSQN